MRSGGSQPHADPRRLGRCLRGRTHRRRHSRGTRQNSCRASGPPPVNCPMRRGSNSCSRASATDPTRRSLLTTTKAAVGPDGSSGRSTSSVTRNGCISTAAFTRGPRPVCRSTERRCSRNRRQVRLSLDRGPIADAHDILDRLDDASTVIWDCRSAGRIHRRARDRRAQRTHSGRRAPRLARSDGSRAAAALAHRHRRAARIARHHARQAASSRIARRIIDPGSRISSAACSDIRRSAVITGRGPNGAIATTHRSRRAVSAR